MIQFLSTENRPPTACPVAPRQDDPPYAKGEPVALFIPCYIDQFYPADRPGDAGTAHPAGRAGGLSARADLLRPAGLQLGLLGRGPAGGPPLLRRLRRRTAGSSAPRPPARRCAGCSSATSTPTRAIVAVGRRVFELTEFLVDILGVTDTGASLPAQGGAAHRLPRAARAGRGRRRRGRSCRTSAALTCCEMPEVEECCGFGGTFSVKMPGTSLAMGRTKAANVVRSGAEVVVSPDISCLMHVGGILRRDPAMRHIRTMHIAEVLVADEK